MKLSEELLWRGFVHQTTFQNIKELDEKELKFYWGVDPSASSMTIGNLASAMMVKVFMKHGYSAVLLIGGATGLIGDPDGKAQERDLKTPEEISKYKSAITTEYKRIFKGEHFEVVDNYDWFKNINYLDFLRNVGKHVPVRQMVARDFVQSRLGDGGVGISYAEFSYSLIQGYDFLHLFENHGVTLQLSGADQWGNSIAGVDLIRRKTGKEAHVLTIPLVLNKTTGVKFGKTEDGAIWLDQNLTTPYKFYQFWLNVEDEAVEDYLKIYTELEKPIIDKLMHDFDRNKSSRSAQKTLAYEATKIVHGKQQADDIVRITEILFDGGDYTNLTIDDFKSLSAELPTTTMDNEGGLTPALVLGGLGTSNSEVRRLIGSGAIYINGRQIPPDKLSFDDGDFIHGYAIVRRGKNTQMLVKR